MSRIFNDEVNAEAILQRMWEQCEHEQFYDVVLIAGTEEKQIPAHRSVLCSSSDYFGTMFTAPFNESTAREVKMPSVDSETAKTLVKYCYMRHIDIREENVEELLIAANFLRFDFVVNACGEFLAEQLHPNNCFALALIAERQNCRSLLKKAKAYCLEHFVDFCKTGDFLRLNSEQLGQLISSDDLRAPCEEEVFKSVVKWIEYNRPEREQNMEELFKLIRMPLMRPSFLMDHVKPLCTTFACIQLYTEATEWHISPERRKINSSSKSTKPRRCRQYLMAITRTCSQLNILYYCAETLKWMKWTEDLYSAGRISVAVMEDNLYIVKDSIFHIVKSTAICLNFGTMTFKEFSPPEDCDTQATLTVLKGFLYALGGTNASNKCLNSVQKWDSINNSWKRVAPMSVSRTNPGLTVFNDKLYVAGGYKDHDALRTCEYYNPEENVWVSIASMHRARNDPGLAVSNGMLYAIGGVRNTTIERYNPASDEWTMLCNLSEWIGGNSCTLFNDKVLLLYSDRVEEYNPITNECKVNSSINGLERTDCSFSYSGELLVEKFIEN